MAKRQFANSPTNPTSTLASALSVGDSTLTLTSDPGTEMPTSGPFSIVVGDDADAKPLDCSSRSGVTVTINGTSSFAASAGASVNTMPTKTDADAWLQNLDDRH